MTQVAYSQERISMMIQYRLAKIKVWTLENRTFLEIVVLYNAEFGTDYFADLLSGKMNTEICVQTDEVKQP